MNLETYDFWSRKRSSRGGRNECSGGSRHEKFAKQSRTARTACFPGNGTAAFSVSAPACCGSATGGGRQSSGFHAVFTGRQTSESARFPRQVGRPLLLPERFHHGLHDRSPPFPARSRAI